MNIKNSNMMKTQKQAVISTPFLLAKRGYLMRVIQGMMLVSLFLLGS